MKRIRYRQVIDSPLYVAGPFLAGTDHINAYIETDKMTFEIVNLDGRSTLTGTSNNLQNLKKNVKLVLREMGVQFEDEVRPRIK